MTQEIAKKSTLKDISLNQYVTQALEHYVHNGEEINTSIQSLNSSIDELNDCVVTIAYQTDRKHSSTTEKFDTRSFIATSLN